MKHPASLAALAFVLAACGGSETPAPATPAAETPAVVETPPASPAAASDAVTAEGWGPLKIGMTKDEVVAAVGDKRNPDAAGIPGDCEDYQPKNTPEGLWVMIEAGKLTSITIGDMSKLKTDKGLGLGDSAEAVKEAYGAAAVATPHKYQDKPAEYITVWNGGPRNEPYVQDENARGLVYEIDGTGKVGAIHAGGPSIQYVEGCA
ncbi:MAG: hypothetical protein ABMA14_07080 [Hyphomonadaceae bacterium]